VLLEPKFSALVGQSVGPSVLKAMLERTLCLFLPSSLTEWTEINVVAAGRGVTSISRLLSLVLPFTAGALLHALEGLCQQPHLPALALVGFALLQPSAVSFGR